MTLLFFGVLETVTIECGVSLTSPLPTAQPGSAIEPQPRITNSSFFTNNSPSRINNINYKLLFSAIRSPNSQSSTEGAHEPHPEHRGASIKGRAT
jgi:hypothetical protein